MSKVVHVTLKCSRNRTGRIRIGIGGWFMSWHQLESHNYFYKGEISLAYGFFLFLTPYILPQNPQNPQNQRITRIPRDSCQKRKSGVRKLKDIKGQKSPKLSDRRPTIKKLIEENRGNYQILHRPQKIGWPEQNWKNRNSRFFQKNWNWFLIRARTKK